MCLVHILRGFPKQDKEIYWIHGYAFFKSKYIKRVATEFISDNAKAELQKSLIIFSLFYKPSMALKSGKMMLLAFLPTFFDANIIKFII